MQNISMFPEYFSPFCQEFSHTDTDGGKTYTWLQDEELVHSHIASEIILHMH